MTDYNAFSGVQALQGTVGSDRFFITQFALDSGDSIDGLGGTDQLVLTDIGFISVSNQYDFCSVAVSNIEAIGFSTSTSASYEAIFRSSQFGGTGLSNNLAITGTSGFNSPTESITVVMDGAHTLDASGWTVSPQVKVWVQGSSAGDLVVGPQVATLFQSLGGNDTLVGGAADDTIEGGAGADVLTGGGGSDFFQGSVDELNGDTITDFSPGDRIRVFNATADTPVALNGNQLTIGAASVTLSSSPGGRIVVNSFPTQLDIFIVPGPADEEQLYLELINDARLNPMGDAARYISSYRPLTSSDADIQSALNFFKVSGTALKSAYQALVPVAPVAWNDNLASAARSHDSVMIAQDTQTHQGTGEASLGTRITAAGYTGWTGLGENVYAFSDSTLYGHAGFMVDWGGNASTGGMQSPPGHRDNIMNANWTEVGVGVVAETNPATSVGPQVVTEDFGTRGHHFVLGVAYTDSDANNFYSVGEGRADLVVSIGGRSATSTSSGGYALDLGGVNGTTILLSGGGIAGPASVSPTSLAENLKLDVVNGTTLKISGSGLVNGFARIEGLGAKGLVLSAGPGNQTLVGTIGNDTLSGDAGDDVIDGQGGSDTALYAAISRATASIARNSDRSLSVNSASLGSDTLRHVEQVSFADGLFSFTFIRPGAAVVANFNPANGWASQDGFARHVADVNGDGYLDIVGFGYAGMLVSFGSAGGGFSSANVVLSDFGQNSGWTSDNGFHRELADVNGDGHADVIGFGYAGTLVSLAQASGSYGAVTIGLTDFGVNQGWASQNGFARTVGDVNGDGKADIVGFGYAGALVALGNGNGTFQPVKTAIANFGVNQGWTSDNSFHRAVADVNGDGKADIIGFGIAGTYVALSNGDGTFAPAQLVLNDFGANQGWSSNDSFSRLVADVNGDHVADIVGFGIAGTLVAFGKGDGTFTAASLDVGDFGKNQGWTSDNTYHREVADLNHDGLADVVGFGIAGVLVGLNQGDFLV